MKVRLGEQFDKMLLSGLILLMWGLVTKYQLWHFPLEGVTWATRTSDIILGALIVLITGAGRNAMTPRPIDPATLEGAKVISSSTIATKTEVTKQGDSHATETLPTDSNPAAPGS